LGYVDDENHGFDTALTHRIILIWDEGTITGSNSIAAGIEYPDKGLHFPATGTPFVGDGI
jgi:hypothetical protein